MASFSLAPTANATIGTWADESATPSRLNPAAGHPHRYWRVNTAASGTLKLSITMAGNLEPTDAVMGDVMQWSWVESASPSPPITSPAGQTSIAEVELSQLVRGHHQILAWFPGGGSVALMFMVKDPGDP